VILAIRRQSRGLFLILDEKGGTHIDLLQVALNDCLLMKIEKRLFQLM